MVYLVNACKFDDERIPVFCECCQEETKDFFMVKGKHKPEEKEHNLFICPKCLHKATIDLMLKVKNMEEMEEQEE